MRPLNLIISGWGCYKEVIEIRFEQFVAQSLFLITGPTGAGKTTIFDAITFALYGDVSGKIREKTSVRSDFALGETETFVDFIFSHRGEQYHIRRTPKYERPMIRKQGMKTVKETVEFYLPDQTPITNLGDALCKVEELLGINYEQFKQIVMIAQGEFMELLVSKSRDRVEIFRTLFQTDKYEKIQRKLSEQTKQYEIKLNEFAYKMKEVVNSIEIEEQEQLTTLVQAQYLNYPSILTVLQAYIEGEQANYQLLEEKIKQLQQYQIQLLEKISKGKEKNKALLKWERLQTELKKLEEETKDMISLQEEVVLAEKAKQAKEEEFTYELAKEQGDILHKKQEKIKEQLANRKEELGKIKQDYNKVEQKKEQLEQLKREYSEKEQQLDNLKELMTGEEEQRKIKEKLEEVLLQEKEWNNKIRTNQIEIQFLGKEIKLLEWIELYLQQLQYKIKEEKSNLQQLERLQQKEQELLKEKENLYKIQGDYKKQEDSYKKQKNRYEQLEQSYRDCMIGLAAKYLEQGTPCPVCGSLDHPSPVIWDGQLVEEETVKKQKDKMEQEKIRLDQFYQYGVQQNSTINRMEQDIIECKEQLFIGQQPLASLIEQKREQLKELNKEEKKLEEEKIKKEQYLEKREQLEIQNITFQEKVLCYEEKKEYSKTAYDNICGSLETLKKRAPKLEEGCWKTQFDLIKQLQVDLWQQIKQLNTWIQQVEKLYQEQITKIEEQRQQMIQSELEIQTQIQLIKQYKKMFQEKLLQLGFETEDQYTRAKRTEEVIQIKKKQVEEIKGLYKQTQILYQQLDLELADKQKIKLELLQLEYNKYKNEIEQLQVKKEQLHGRIFINKKAFHSLTVKQKERQNLEKDYSVIKELDQVTKGNNPERLEFEQYVLTAYFEEIIEAANERFIKMTDQRYELKRMTEVADARKKESLELVVLDYYTGKLRSVKTLSGGESFKAALSLALGLSDIVQRNAGGIWIETMFIDEGFGSLDSESLEQALQVLMSLTEQNKLIGIISHVPQLKEKIDQQIIVEKTPVGSKLSVY